MTFKRALCGGLVLACLLAGPSSAQDTTALTAEELGLVAQDLVDQGQAAQAMPLIEALLARNPGDVRALILITRIANETGNHEAARIYGARAYAATDIPEALYVAARQTALAHAADNQDLRAQLWLRRAVQYAPDDAARSRVAEDFRFLRQRNPLSIDLRFGVSPSSNVNNGSVNETVTGLYGLPFEFVLQDDARALSGLEISGRVQLTYRLAETRNALTEAEVEASMRTFVLSSSAQEQAPDAEGSDYADANLSLGIRHQRIWRDGQLPLSLRAEVGQSWYGGDAYTRFLGVSAAQSWALNDTTRAGLSLNYRLVDYVDDPDMLSDGSTPGADRTFSLGANVAHVLGNGSVVRGSIGWRENASDILNRDYTAQTAGLSYDHGTPILGLRLGGSLSYEDRHYDFSSLAGGIARDDEIWGVQVRAQLTQVEFYGFQPVINVSGSRAESSVDLFDRDSVTVGFDLVSSF